MARTSYNTAQKKKQLLEALRNSLGIVTKAVEEAGIPRRLYYDWMAKDPKFKAEVESLQDVAVDFAESSLMKQIRNGDTTATIFYLKTKGKKRGYIERQEVDAKTEQTIKVVVSDPEIAEEIDRLNDKHD